MCPEVKFLNIKTPTPVGRANFGQAGATGSISGNIEVRRGIDMSTSIDIEGHAGSVVAEMIRVSMLGGISARSAGQLKIGLPLDLFSETGGGVVALLRLQAEIAGFVEATVGANGTLIAEKVGDALPGPLGDLLEIFLDELNVDCGVYAHGGVCAQLVGEAELTGRLLPVSNAGFSFNMQFAAGWYYGYGVDYVANFSFSDTRRMLARTSTVTSNLLLAEADAHIAGLPPASAEPARAAMPYLRVLLPAATRALFELGAQLATSEPQEHSRVAVRSILDSLFAQAQQMVLDALLDLAAARIDAWLSSIGIDERFLHMALAARQAVLEDLTNLADAVEDLTTRTLAQPADWVEAVVALLSPLERLATSSLMPDDIRPTIDYVWAATRLVEGVVTWATGAGHRPDPFGSTDPVDIAGAVQAAQRVAASRNVATGALVPDELVQFLVAAKPLVYLRSEVPEAAAALEWIGELTGRSTDDLFRDILAGAGALAEGDMELRVETLTTLAAAALRDHVLPHLVDPVIAQADEQMRTFLEQMVRPTLVALPAVILPGISSLGDAGTGMRMGETISAVLLQTSGHYVLHALDVLTDHWITEGATDIERLADEVDQVGRDSPMYTAMAGATIGAFVGVDVQPGDVRDVLRLCAHAMRLWNEKQREATLEALRLVLDLGLRIDGDAALDTILTTDNPPDINQLGAALDQVAQGAWALATDRDLVKACLLAPITHARNQGEAVLRVVKVIVEEVEHLISEALKVLDDLDDRIQELKDAIEGFLGDALHEVAELSHRVRTFTDAILGQMHNFARSILDEVTKDFAPWLRALADDAFEASWQGSTAIITAPLAILDDVAGWVDGTLGALMRTGATDRDVVNEQLRAQILAQPAPTLTFPLVVPMPPWPFPVQVGTISVPAAGLLGLIADAVVGDAEVQQHITSAVDSTKARLKAEWQKTTLEKAKSAGYTQAEADAARHVLANHPTVHPVIAEPADQSVHAGPVQVTLRAEGANEAYLNHPVISSPDRLRVLLNDRELDTGGLWKADRGTMTYTFNVIPPINGDPQEKTPWAQEIWTYRGWGDILHRGYSQVVGAAGINTVSVVCLDSPNPPQTVSFALPMPQRCDLLLYGRDTGDTWTFSVAGRDPEREDRHTTVILTPKTVVAGGPWSSIVAGRFTGDPRTCVAFYNLTSGMLRWTLMDSDGVLTVAGEKYVGGGWTHLVAGHFNGRDLDDLLFHRDDMWAGQLWVPDPAGGEGALLDEPNLMGGWDLVVSVGLKGPRDRLVTYRRADGYTRILAADEHGVLQQDGNDSLMIGAGWTRMTSGDFGGPNGHDLYCANDTAGNSQTWEFDQLGSIVALDPATAPTGAAGPILAAAGDFFHGGGSDTLCLWDTKQQLGGWLRRIPSTGVYALVPNSGILELPNETFTDVLTGRFL